MTNPYGPAGGNDPQQWGQQPYPGTPSGNFPQQGGGFGQPHSGGFGQQGGFDPNQQQPGQYGGQYGGGFDPNAGQYGQQGQQQGGFVPQGGQPQYGFPPQQPGFDPNQPQFGQQPGQYVGGFDPNAGQFGQQQSGFPAQPHYGFPQQPGFGPGQPQFGQPGFGVGQQPGEPKKSKAPLLIGGGVVALVVVVVLVGGLVWPGWFNSKVFDQSKLQDGVKKILTEEYQLTDVAGVSCPSGKAVTAGSTFSCEVTVGGAKKQVMITVKNADGVYEVAKPA